MKFLNKSYVHGVISALFATYFGVTLSLLTLQFSVLPLVIMLACLAGFIFITYLSYKLAVEAKRVGLMTRAEHRTELRHEAELQSIWESK